MSKITQWGTGDENYPKMRAMGISGVVVYARNGYFVGTGGEVLPDWFRGYGDAARGAGLETYLMSRLTNYYNDRTLLVDWWDDDAWARLIPSVRLRAREAKALQYKGFAFDEEPYGVNGVMPTWNWNYLGNMHSREQNFDKAYQRGREFMGALMAEHPGAEIITYGNVGLYNDWLQHQVNSAPYPATITMQNHFWRGALSVHGYGDFWLADASFYKNIQTTPPLPYTKSWDGIMQMNTDGFEVTKRTFFAEADQARLHITPMTSAGPIEDRQGPFNMTYPLDYVTAQLTAAARNSSGMFVNYAYDSFDLTPYASAFKAAAATTASSTPLPAPTTFDFTVVARDARGRKTTSTLPITKVA